jgi:hypothetical protein
MNLDQTLGLLDPGFDWNWSRRPVFHADNSGFGRLDREILHDESEGNLGEALKPIGDTGTGSYGCHDFGAAPF